MVKFFCIGLSYLSLCLNYCLNAFYLIFVSLTNSCLLMLKCYYSLATKLCNFWNYFKLIDWKGFAFKLTWLRNIFNNCIFRFFFLNFAYLDVFWYHIINLWVLKWLNLSLVWNNKTTILFLLLFWNLISFLF